jgi:hypothetical protein
MADAQSEVAVQPIWIFACAAAEPANAQAISSEIPSVIANLANCLFKLSSQFAFFCLDYRYFIRSYIFNESKGCPR